jgi:cytochrome c oxidase subunit 4
MTLADYRRSRGEPEVRETAQGAHAEHHPTAWSYLQIGLILAIITAAEVALYYIALERGLLIALLAIMSVAKFALVVLWFMHLWFDNRLFGYLFATGLFGTMILFAIVLGISAANVV